jgi:hypothetical protein
MLTPYQFASNRPIDGIDLDGLEYMDAETSMFVYVGDPRMSLVTFDDVRVRNIEVFNLATYGLNDIKGPVASNYSDSNLALPMGKLNKTQIKKVQQAIINNSNANKRGASKFDLLVELVNFHEGIKKFQHLKNNQEEISNGVNSVRATINAVNLVGKAIEDNALPGSISGNLDLVKGITNFIVDGSLGDENTDLVESVGLALFENRKDVFEGNFSLNDYEQVFRGDPSAGDLFISFFVPVPSLDPVKNRAKSEIKKFEASQSQNSNGSVLRSNN